MIIYGVKVYNDLYDSCNGIDDCHIYLFKDIKDAEIRYKEEIEETYKYFLDKYEETKETLQITEYDTGIQIYNEVDYITCELIELEVN